MEDSGHGRPQIVIPSKTKGERSVLLCLLVSLPFVNEQTTKKDRQLQCMSFHGNNHFSHSFPVYLSWRKDLANTSEILQSNDLSPNPLAQFPVALKSKEDGKRDEKKVIGQDMPVESG